MNVANDVIIGGVGGAAGVGAVAGVQAAAGALVPWAMSTFGTVVAGVGTVHAAGGVAATLQYVSMVATPVGPAIVVGAAVAIGARYLFGARQRQAVQGEDSRPNPPGAPRPCPGFHSPAGCPYGKECRFAH